MTTTAALDYVTEANDNLTEALKPASHSTRFSRVELIALAQVNATLALAEQTRLSNLIAYQASLAAHASSGSLEEVREILSAISELSALIREGLGL